MCATAYPPSGVDDPIGAVTSLGGDPPRELALRQLRAAIESHVGESGAANTAMRLFVSELDHRMLYDQVLAVTLELLDLAAGMLFLHDAAQQVVHLQAYRGIPQAVAEQFRTCKVRPDTDDILSRCLRERRMVTIDAAEPDELAEAAQVLGVPDLSAVAARPLVLGREIIGVLLVCARQGRWALIGQNLARFHALADALAAAVGHETLYTQKLENVTAELIAVLSHEFRTPLTSILGFAEVLADGDAEALNDEQLSYVHIIEASAKRLQRQVENLLTLSRLREGSLPFARRPIQLAQAVTSVVTFLGPRFDAQDLRCHVSVPDDLPMVSADARALDQILFHLLDNALKFTPPGGEVYIRAARHEDAWVALSILNTGASISTEEQAGLFSAFYKTASSTQAVLPGAGVGLAIVRGLVEQHGGRIWVDSTWTTGTTFSFTLPVNASAPTTRERGSGSTYGQSTYR